ncbi:MAG: lamin tail domain-containing protein [Elusimicrobiota bacterium]
MRKAIKNDATLKLKVKNYGLFLAFIFHFIFLIFNYIYGVWADHIVISELATGSTHSPKDEFIELYNPTGKTIDISEWRIQYKGTGEKQNWVSKAVIPSDTKIAAYSFYLIANTEPNYSGCKADLTRDYPWGLLTEEGSIRIIDYNGQEIDKIGYGINAIECENAPVENDGVSLARQNYGVDTDDNKNDFVATKKRTPQNSASIPQMPESTVYSDSAIARHPSGSKIHQIKQEKELECESLYRDAKADWRDNKIFDCIEKLKKIGELDPKNNSAKNELQGIPKKIKEDLEKKNLVGRDQFYGEAVLYYLNNDYKSAATNLKKILILTPENAEIKQWYEKISALIPPEKNIPLSPPPPVVEKPQAQPHPTQPKPAKVKKPSTTPVISQPTSAKKDIEKAEEYYNNGLKEYSAGYISKAIELWEMCLKYAPNHERAKNALAKAKKTLKK